MAAPLQIGRYVLHGEIASGGMASVHYGRLVGTGGFAKTVAIKRLHRALAQTPSFRNMILEEARLAARVRHPNVVPPLDVLAEGNELLLVMEYVHGESLSKLLRSAWAGGERVPLPVGAAILSNVLHGLHAAHEAKDESGKPLDIVHRDVSPQNIIVGADGVARVIDFGIAKAVTSEEATVAGTIKGKVPYLSPEQLEGEPATKRTDLYAAAVVFWEVLANRRLFEGADDAEVLRNIMVMEVRPPSAYNPLVAATVDDVVLQALSRDPKDRFASAREMALELESAVHLATATVVGAWTERLAANTLAKRAEHIRAVEAMPPPAEEIAASPPATVRSSAAAAGLPPAPPSAPRSGPQSGPQSGPRSQRPPPPLPAAASRPPPPLPSPATAQMSTQAIPPIPAPPAPGAPRITIPPPPAPGSVRASIPHASQQAPPPSQRAASTPPVRPPMASRPPIEPRTVIYEPPPMPEPAFVEGVRPVGRDAPPLSGPASGPLSGPASAPRPPPAGALRQPEIAIRNVDWLAPAEQEKAAPGSAFKRFLRYLAAFLVLTLIVAYMFAPALVRAWLVTGARARGIDITIDRVDVSRKAIRLNDLHAESKDLPGASLRAGTVVIGLRWLVPEQITVDDAELELDGQYSTLSTRLEQYRVKHGASVSETIAGLRNVEITSGHIEWKNVIGTGTSALVENITFDMTKNSVRAFGDDYHFSAPLFTMKLAGAPAGPWQIDVDRQGILVRSVLRFDPTGTYPASVTRTAGDDGSISLTLQVPPTSLTDLHLPAAVLGPIADQRTRLEAHGEISVVAVSETTTHAGDASVGGPLASTDAGLRGAGRSDGGARDGSLAASGAPAAALQRTTLTRSVSGHIVLAAGGLALFPGASPVDLSLDLPLAGDAAKTIPVIGVLAIAPADASGGASKAAASASLKGTLDVSGPAARLELTGQTGAIPCAKPPTATGATGSGAAAAAAASKDGSNAVLANINVSLDDLPGARVSLQPLSTCPPKLR